MKRAPDEVAADADYVREKLLQARRDALAGKFGPLGDSERREIQLFLEQHDKGETK